MNTIGRSLDHGQGRSVDPRALIPFAPVARAGKMNGKHDPIAATDRLAMIKRLALILQLCCLAAGAVVHFWIDPGLATAIWSFAALVALALMIWEMAHSVLVGSVALDIVAVLALIVALALGEALAGTIVATMYLGGQWLEDLAHGRVQRDMNALLERAPRVAKRFTKDGLERVDVADIRPGDRLLVSRGEVVPVDGALLSPTAAIDQSSLSGEALPVNASRGDLLLSGVSNASDAFEMQATKPYSQSTYAGIVKLVEEARASKSPTMRIADRYAVFFLIVTVVTSTLAWIISGDPVRALSVLVVATPCPLILAVPIAILSGVSRSARRGVLVKGGDALEALAKAETLLLDKTGTITDGRARLVDIRTVGSMEPPRLLSLAASLEQGSHHVMAESIVAEARRRKLPLSLPERLKEEAGSGLEGWVEGQKVSVGGTAFIGGRIGSGKTLGELQSIAQGRGVTLVCVAVDGQLAGGLFMADSIRIETPTVLQRLRDAGMKKIVLLTGDDARHAGYVAATLGLTEFRSGLQPSDKIAAVHEERARGSVIMVGDGVNDAPALAAADVGVAMGARGAAASAEAADIVLLVDRLDRLVAARQIAERSIAIARQSAIAGMLLSCTAMAVAVTGHLSPIQGALLQELIDIAVILNALRALGASLFRRRPSASLAPAELVALEEEHRGMIEVIGEITALADDSPKLPADELQRRLVDLDILLTDRLLRHEARDEQEIFPRLRGSRRWEPNFTGISRTHMEIRRRLYVFKALAGSLSPDAGDAERREIQRLLDGLAAIAVLHIEEEEEIYRLLEAG
jgi:heavy metal translocating P-type ATPase